LLKPFIDGESCLTPSPSIHYSLGPIKINQSTNAGNLKILENIFLQQYRLSKKDDFQHRLTLIYGDQKTVARLRSIKSRRAEDMDPYESLQWILPVPALFHLKMNWVALIHKTHFQQKHSQNPASLAYSQYLLNRKKVHHEKADFFALEEFLIHNFQGRIVAAIQAELETKEKLPFEQRLSNSTPESLNHAINQVASRLFDPPLDEVTDREYHIHLNFLRMVLSYQTLKFAIKHANLLCFVALF
jgi:hypothetical protein